MLSLDVLVERFCFDIGKVSGGGVIVAERRDPTLDRELELAWLNLKIEGTRYLQAKHIESRIVGLNLRAKGIISQDFNSPTLSCRRSGGTFWAKPTKKIGRSCRKNSDEVRPEK